MTQLSLYEVATRLRRYITQPLPLLASNATFVLMNIAEWQQDDPNGTLTVGEFYNLSKYNADAVLPFNGISSAVAEHLTTIIYNWQKGRNIMPKNTEDNKSLVKEFDLLPAPAYLLAVQILKATEQGDVLKVTTEQQQTLSMLTDHLLELLGLSISRNMQDIQTATIVIE